MNSLIVLGGLDDSLQVFGTLGPGEGVAGLVVAGEEAMQEVLKVPFGVPHAVRQATSRLVPKLVSPRFPPSSKLAQDAITNAQGASRTIPETPLTSSRAT